MEHCCCPTPAKLQSGSKLARCALLGCCWQKGAAFLQPGCAQGIAIVKAARTYVHHHSNGAAGSLGPPSSWQHDCHEVRPDSDAAAL